MNAESGKASGVLVRLDTYSRYLYEEELDRTSRLNGATRNLFLVMGATVAFVGTTLQWWVPRPAASLLLEGAFTRVTLAALPAGALVFGVVSFVFMLLALQVRTFERPCDPRALAIRSLFIDDEDELLAQIVSNYLVATERNYEVNERKAAMLSRAFATYLVAVLLLAASAVTIGLENLRS